jgi:hypothetical protein
VTAVAGQQRPRQLGLKASYQNTLTEEEEQKHASKTESWTRARNTQEETADSLGKLLGPLFSGHN